MTQECKLELSEETKLIPFIIEFKINDELLSPLVDMTYIKESTDIVAEVESALILTFKSLTKNIEITNFYSKPNSSTFKKDFNTILMRQKLMKTIPVQFKIKSEKKYGWIKGICITAQSKTSNVIINIDFKEFTDYASFNEMVNNFLHTFNTTLFPFLA